jgi:hypothetical protein
VAVSSSQFRGPCGPEPQGVHELFNELLASSRGNPEPPSGPLELPSVAGSVRPGAGQPRSGRRARGRAAPEVGAVSRVGPEGAAPQGVLGQVGPGRLNRAQLADFKRLYGTHADGELAQHFGLELRAVRALAMDLALGKDKGFSRGQPDAPPTRMPRWTQPDLERLRRLYPTSSNVELARLLMRSVKSVVSKAHLLGLRKSAERLVVMGRENVALRLLASQGTPGSKNHLPTPKNQPSQSQHKSERRPGARAKTSNTSSKARSTPADPESRPAMQQRPRRADRSGKHPL